MASVTGPERGLIGRGFLVALLAVSVKSDLTLHDVAFAFVRIMAILAHLNLVAFLPHVSSHLVNMMAFVTCKPIVKAWVS
jgi:hypothetical protein